MIKKRSLLKQLFISTLSLAICSCAGIRSKASMARALPPVDTTQADSTGIGVTTFAGQVGGSSLVDGPLGTNKFFNPNKMVFDRNGNLFVSDYHNDAIRRITPDGVVTTIAGNGVAGYKNGTPANKGDFTTIGSQFSGPAGLALDNGGNLLVADEGNNVIRRITPDGNITLFAGRLLDVPRVIIWQRGGHDPLRAQKLGHVGDMPSPDSIHIPTKETDPAFHYDATAPSQNRKARGRHDARTLVLDAPIALAVDRSNNVYVLDQNGSDLNKITPNGMAETIRPIETTPKDGHSMGPPLHAPTDMAIDPNGEYLIILDGGSHSVKKLALRDRSVTLLAGNGMRGFSEMDGASLGQFNAPTGLAIGKDGSIYVGDAGNQLIRRLIPSASGKFYSRLETVAGLVGVAGSNDGNANRATFNYPGGLAIDAQGNLYVADFFNSEIRRVSHLR